ncbi:MAG: hypothetical protein B7Z08_01050 [Sphingomonadales bacterium 32-68-7]|nr:MAG: hypothetical protein B7Z33_03275 [Sphingomonadales bacterium 12-68-11]OYX10429.1 MAG: hypothetical protein B7Z08_01050 [Sphingomonadales bacterium 32-68-7]
MLELDNRDYAHFYFDDYDLEAQLIAIRAFLGTARSVEADETAEIEALAERAKKAGSEHLVGMWTDAVHTSVYHDAARSAAAVGMLAPFVENLFTGIFRGIGKMGEDRIGHEPNSARSQRAQALFWDPHFYFANREVKEDLISGIVQLAEAADLAAHLPADLKPVLEALFGYRNQVLHNGFEWPVEKREAFGNRIKTWPAGWFNSATTGGKPWVWYMTEAFIARVLAFIDEVLDAAGQHVRLHYAQDEAAPAG